jgi:hypothetical protein
MGDLSGAKNIYNGVYFSSDPAIPGEFQIYRVGNYKASSLIVYLPNVHPPTNQFPKVTSKYRSVFGGATHVNSGEVFAIYINGRLLAESTRGVGVRQGGQPRGSHVYHDFRQDFGGGTVTIAATSLLRYQHPRIKPYPPRGHFTLRIQE